MIRFKKVKSRKAHLKPRSLENVFIQRCLFSYTCNFVLDSYLKSTNKMSHIDLTVKSKHIKNVLVNSHVDKHHWKPLKYSSSNPVI